MRRHEKENVRCEDLTGKHEGSSDVLSAYDMVTALLGNAQDNITVNMILSLEQTAPKFDVTLRKLRRACSIFRLYQNGSDHRFQVQSTETVRNASAKDNAVK